jgi:FlgD Ig-like domain
MCRIFTARCIYTLVIIFAAGRLNAQSCDQAEVTLTTQEEVDNFPLRFCNTLCSLTITGNDITNLDSLYVLQRTGSLVVQFNPMLTDLDGLSSLALLAGECGTTGLNISYNNLLSNIDGLSSLTKIGGAITIYSNTMLTNLDGLANVDSLGGSREGQSIYISSNASLENIDGLSRISHVPSEVVISNHPGLLNIDGLSSLKVIGAAQNTGGLYLASNDALTNLNGLASLDSLRGRLVIELNSALTSVQGLSNLDYIGEWDASGEAIRLSGNDVLTNIDGLGNLSIINGWVIVENNPALLNLDGLSSVTKLGGNGARNSGVTIRDNAALTSIAGLSSITRIEMGRGAFLEIVNNPNLEAISLSSMEYFQGNLVASMSIQNNTKIKNLDQLSALKTVTAGIACSIKISGNTALENIDGLSSLELVRASTPSISITDNTTLGRFCGLFTLFSNDGFGPGPGYPSNALTISGNERNPTREEIENEGPCSELIPQPTNLTFTQVFANGMRVSYSRSAGFVNGYIVLMKSYGAPAPEDVPIDGEEYHVGEVIGSSTIVVHVGADSTLMVSGLSPSTPYYFDVFAWRNTAEGIDYQTVGPLEGSQTTAGTTLIMSALTFTEVTDNSITVSLDEAQEGNYITLMKAFGYPSPSDKPINGRSYSVGNVIGGSTIVVNKGIAFPFTTTYLMPATPYYFDVYRYDPATLVYELSPWQGSQATLAQGESLLAADELHPYPNPFDGMTTIPFKVETPNSTVQVTIYDMVGREVDVLTIGSYDRGVHETSWSGSDRQGKRVLPGVYVYSVRSEMGVVVGRVSVR